MSASILRIAPYLKARNSNKSKKAAAVLYLLVQATARLRVSREKGEQGQPRRLSLSPTLEDVKAVERAHPDLVAVARGTRICGK